MTRRTELDPRDADPREVYFVLSALVVPRPIAWISTLSADGVPNLAPHSYFTIAANHPPHIAFSSTGVRDTLSNIRATGEFVVNVVSTPLLERMNLTSAELPADIDEFAYAGLTTAPSVTVRPPRVAEAHAHLECRAVHELPVGGAHLVIAEVLHLHAAEELWVDDRVDAGRLDPVARLAGANYSSLGPVVHLPRPALSRPGTGEDG